MSRNSSRRRTYGRRQHEVKERKRQSMWPFELSDDLGALGTPGPRNPDAQVRALRFPRSPIPADGDA
jgi:hypothetical protein